MLIQLGKPFMLFGFTGGFVLSNAFRIVFFESTQMFDSPACVGSFTVASFRRDAKYEPTGRAQRRIHGVPGKELTDVGLGMGLAAGVLVFVWSFRD